MEKVTLVCTSLDRDSHLTCKMLKSAKGFDETIYHINGKGCSRINNERTIETYFYDKFNVPDAYNYLIGNFVTTEWICCFPDDDFFYPYGLENILHEVHQGIDADVAHFRFKVSGYLPKQDYRGRIFKAITGRAEYELCERKPITPELLKKHCRLPAGTFFRKSAWKKVGGFSGDFEHDRLLWIKMAEAGCTFKFFNHLVYEFYRREGSAWFRQQKENT